MEKKYWKLHNDGFGNCIGESHITNGNIEFFISKRLIVRT